MNRDRSRVWIAVVVAALAAVLIGAAVALVVTRSTTRSPEETLVELFDRLQSGDCSARDLLSGGQITVSDTSMPLECDDVTLGYLFDGISEDGAGCDIDIVGSDEAEGGRFVDVRYTISGCDNGDGDEGTLRFSDLGEGWILVGADM